MHLLAAIDCILKDGGSGVLFKCSSCRCSSGSTGGNTSGNPTELNTALIQVFEIVKSLAVNVAQMSNQLNILINHNQTNAHQQIGQGATNSGNFSRDNLYVELREYEERKKRAKSIIVKGTGANSDTEFSGIFGDVCQNLLSECPAHDVFCINRDTNMYRVTFQDKAARVAILPLAKNLKNIPQFDRIFLSRDLTYMQRQELIRKRASDRSRMNVPEGSPGIATGANSTPVAQSDALLLSSAPVTGVGGTNFQ